MKQNPNSIRINELIEKGNPNVFGMLSERGKFLYYPLTGLLEQSREAKEKAERNATLGMFLNEDGRVATPEALAKLVNIDAEKVFRYGPSYGDQSFREEWHKQLYEKNPKLEGKSTSLPISTVGLTHGINAVYNLFVNLHDKVIIPTPTWGNYLLSLSIAEPSAEHVNFELFTPDNTGYNLEALESTLNGQSSEKKIVMFTNPHNPTGYTVTKDEANRIKGIVLKAAKKGNKLVTVVDDAYFGFFYEEDTLQESLFSYLADLHENVLAVKLDGITKEMSSYGLRVGTITFSNKCDNQEELYRGLEHKVAGFVRGTVSNAPLISQSLASAALSDEEFTQETEENFEVLKRRYKLLKNELENPKYQEFLDPLPFNSGFFMCFRGKEGLDMQEVRRRALDEYGSGFVALSNDLLRVAYSGLSLDDIPAALDNLYDACKDISKKG